MARPRTATKVLEMRGAFKANPARKRPNEPQVSGVFQADPPEHLSADVAACWREIVACVPAGVLTPADAPIVEVTAALFADFRAHGAEMQGQRLTRMCALMGRLGLDPSGRAGLVAPSGKRNKFGDV